MEEEATVEPWADEEVHMVTVVHLETVKRAKVVMEDKMGMVK